MREALRRAGIGLYFLWLLFVVLLILGRYTPFPLFDLVHSGVVFGAAVLTVVGAGKLFRIGYRQTIG
jgi:hypothetical protein